jgi:protein-tyrosine phosphatase
VDLPGVYNARNEGGLLTTSGLRVKHQVLIRSGHLADLGTAGCQRLDDLGIRSVVDLRASDDAAATPDAPCVASTSDYYLADLPKILPPSVTSYGQTLDAAEPKLAAIFAHLSAEQALPAVVHCVIGRDRASLVMAVVLLALGVPQSEVANDFVANQDASVDVDAAWLAPLFDRVSAAGGIEPYLLAHGVTQVMIDKLRSLALESP